MGLLGREVSEQGLEKMKSDWNNLRAKTKELKDQILIEEKYLETLENVEASKQRLFILMDAANCWANFQKIVYDLANTEISSQELFDTEQPPMLLPESDFVDDSEDE